MHTKALRQLSTTGAALAMLVAAGSAFAQTRAATLDEMRLSLRPGDIVSIARSDGEQITGKLVRVGENDIEVRTKPQSLARYAGNVNVRVPNAEIRWLDRPRDPVRNGVLVGLGVGGGFSAAMFTLAAATDSNEMDEWGQGYAIGAVALTSIGALIGWGIDAAISRPHMRYDAPSGSSPRVSLAPIAGKRRGLAVVFSF